jgi:hypothetical protein
LLGTAMEQWLPTLLAMATLIGVVSILAYLLIAG